MQTAKQSSSDDLWLVPSDEVDWIARFVEPAAIANDFAALPTASEPDGLLRAIKKAASWLMAETVFGLAAYGAAAHACPLDRAWSPYDRRV
jgi:hypothetical protein